LDDVTIELEVAADELAAVAAPPELVGASA
jgi:hypothetical protein